MASEVESEAADIVLESVCSAASLSEALLQSEVTRNNKLRSAREFFL